VSESESKSSKLSRIAFGDGYGSPNSESDSISRLIEKFEQAAQTDDDGVEHWLARELQKLLGYTEYRNFSSAISKAIEACRLSGQIVENHFVDVNEMVEIGSGAGREITDFKLTRYACYLIAQNGDARKKQIAFAQTYFAIQTRRQEIQDDDVEQYAPLNEDHKRLLLRDEIKTHNKNLASAAKGAGVVALLDFAIFQTFGYKGLYGGLDRAGIQRRKGLKSKENILDHMGSTELAANLFRATQTEEKLQREKTQGKDRANNLHYEVGKRVRQTIQEIGGTMPERLPTAENIEKVVKRLKKAETKALNGTDDVDEQ
jgi:DNA-damage-inducible protein D